MFSTDICERARGAARREVQRLVSSRLSLLMRRQHRNRRQTRFISCNFSLYFFHLLTFSFLIRFTSPTWPFFFHLMNIYWGNNTSVWTIRILGWHGRNICLSSAGKVKPLHQLCARWESSSEAGHKGIPFLRLQLKHTLSKTQVVVCGCTQSEISEIF